MNKKKNINKISYNIDFKFNIDKILIDYEIDYIPKENEINYIDFKDKKINLYEKGNRRKTKRETK